MPVRKKLPIFFLAALLACDMAMAESGHIKGGGGADELKLSANGDSSRKISDKEIEARAFQLTGLDGATYKLEFWKGKVVVLNFWATWCSPCLYEIRDFVAYQEQYKARGLQFVGIGLDTEKKLRNVQRTLEINYPILVADPMKNADLMKLWGNSSGVVPYTVVIGRDGRIVFTQLGLMSRETLIEKVIPLIDPT